MTISLHAFIAMLTMTLGFGLSAGRASGGTDAGGAGGGGTAGTPIGLLLTLTYAS